MITVNLKQYDEFTRKIWALVVDKAIDTWIKKAVIKLRWEVSKEQVNQKVFDKWVLANSYRESFSKLRWELYNFRQYWVFVHEWHKQQVGRFVPAIWKRLKKPFIKGRPWFTDALEKNKEVPEQIISQELYKLLSKLWVK
jgi:hypothetical protein